MMKEASRLIRLDIYKLILKNIQEKNPKNNHGTTLLHIAAEIGFFEVCKLIMENVIDKIFTIFRGKVYVNQC